MSKPQKSSQTPAELSLVKLFQTTFTTQIKNQASLSSIKIVPATPSSESIMIQRTSIILVPLDVLTIIKRNYKIISDIKKIIPGSKIYLVRDSEIHKNNLKGITEDICFPAKLKGILNEYVSEDDIRKKVLVENYHNSEGEGVKEMEVVYETIVGNECRFEISNF